MTATKSTTLDSVSRNYYGGGGNRRTGWGKTYAGGVLRILNGAPQKTLVDLTMCSKTQMLMTYWSNTDEVIGMVRALGRLPVDVPEIVAHRDKINHLGLSFQLTGGGVNGRFKDSGEIY